MTRNRRRSPGLSIRPRLDRILLLVLLSFSTLLPGSSPRHNAEGPALSEVVRNGRMLVGIDPSYPPFANIDEAGTRIVGFDVDLANAIGQILGVEVQFVYVDVGSIFDGLLVKRYDAIISAIPPYPELTRQVAYSRHYFNAGQVILRRRTEITEQTGISLHEQAVGVELGSAGEEELRKQAKSDKTITVRSFDLVENALDALTKGEIDSVVTDYLTCLEKAKDFPELAINGTFLTFEPYVVAVRKKDPLLLREINAALLALEVQGTLEDLNRLWITGPATTDSTDRNLQP